MSPPADIARVSAAAAFSGAAVALATVSADGLLVDANDAFALLLGYRRDEMLGRPVLSFADPDDNQWNSAAAAQFSAGEIEAASRERRYVHRDGSFIDTRFSVRYVREPAGDFFICSVEDISAFKTVQHENELLLEVLALLSDAPDFDSAVTGVLETLCRDTSWSLAQLWLPAGDGELLAAASAWFGAGDTINAMREASVRKVFSLGQGIVGGAWETGATTWWSDGDGVEPEFGRTDAARAAGLATGVAVPLSMHGNVNGVVEFFSACAIDREAGATQRLIRVASHLGSMVTRRLDEQTLRDSEHRLRVITEGAPVAVVSTEADGRIVGWNAAASALFGMSASSAIGRPVTALMPERVRAAQRGRVAELLATGRVEAVRQVPMICARANGEEFSAETSISSWDWLGRKFFTVIMRDVSAERASENRLRSQSDRLAAIVHVQNEVLRAATSVAAVQQLVVERAEALLVADGAALEVADGDEMVYVAAAGAASGHLGLRLDKNTSLSGLCATTGVPQLCADTETDERVNREACRRIGMGAMLVVPLFDAGESVGALKVFTRAAREWPEDEVRTLQLLAASIGTAMLNARRHEHAVAQAEKALYDELTGLPRRELLADRMRHAHDRMHRNGHATITYFIDLDGFKAINDTLGHAVGDELLVAVAGRLTASLRGADTAARIGGDEFVAFCEDVTPDAARMIADRILMMIREPYVLSGHVVSVGASIGVAVSLDPAESATDLLARADAAMYEAKHSGKGRAVIAGEPSLNRA